jgi:PadR family transcriptional regulator PadR
VPPSTELLKGTLDLLILKTLDLEPRHGISIADRIAQITRGTFQVKPGSLFPALHRLEEKGWVAGEWGQLESGRRAKCYALTPAGRKQLSQEKKDWRRVNAAINQVLAEES